MHVRCASAWSLFLALSAPAVVAAQPTETSAESAAWKISGVRRVDVSLHMGLGARVDEPPLFRSVAPWGLVFGGGLDVFLSERFALGLGYEHIDLGREESDVVAIGAASVSRDLNSLWLRLRLDPVRIDDTAFYTRIGVAAAWQSAELSAVIWPVTQPSSSVPVACEGGASMGLGFGAGVGVDFDLDAGLHSAIDLGAESYLLSDDVLSDCVPGAGSATFVGLRIVLAYGFPVEP